MEQYDKNRDGQLDAAELAAVPGIAKSLRAYDTNRDGKVSADEIAARIAQWQQDGTGLAALACVVQLDGQPLEGAIVRLVPEPFLGDDIHAAQATTKSGGRGVLRIAESDAPSNLRGVAGVAPGLYKVEVTHPTSTLPARYNSKTELGLEFAPDSREMSSGRLSLPLKSGP